MSEKLLFTVILLAAGAFVLQAQDYPVPVLDGPDLTVKADSLPARPLSFPLIVDAPSHVIQLPSTLAPPPFETKEQRAARINARTEATVMRSMRENLLWYQPPKFTPATYAMLFIGRLFLTSPCRIPEGYVPLMNSSNPFLLFKTPGGAPYEHLYSPDYFPQCVRTEYDFASGTYKQVLLPWGEFNANMARSFGGPYQNAPVPRMYFSSTERAVYQ